MYVLVQGSEALMLTGIGCDWCMAKGTPLTTRGCAARVGGGGGCSGGWLAGDVGGAGEDMADDDSWAWRVPFAEIVLSVHESKLIERYSPWVLTVHL